MDLEKKLQNALKEYQSFTKNKAESSCKTFLDGLAEALAAEGKSDATQELKNLQHREAQRLQAHCIHPISGKPSCSAMTHLMAQIRHDDGSTDMAVLYHREEMELATLQEYKKRL